MPDSRRPPYPFIVVLLLLPLMLVAGVWWGGHPQDLPGFLRGLVPGNTRVMSEALNDVQHDYYRRVPSSQLVNASIQGMVTQLGDRFSSYFSPSEYRAYLSEADLHFSGIGTEVRRTSLGLRISRVYDASPAARAGIRVGDLITGADGHALAGLSESDATGRIKGRPGTPVTLQIRRAGRTLNLRVVRATVSVPLVASQIHQVRGIKLGATALATFDAGAHTQLRQAIDRLLSQGARGIVLDLRGNPGGLVDEARTVASIFIPDGPIVTTRGRTQPTTTLTATGGAIRSSIPVVVLVDHGTASAAEIVAGALQDRHRALIVGTHTFGKGVFQEVKPLSNGGALDITVGEYFTPSGHNLGGGGIKLGAGVAPNVYAVSSPHSSRDTALNVALSTLATHVK
ncbi:MAG TPA: S41 family peptidase [Solirubrobacteraceae bacterium]|jgi:carboxyl-terminal processing protease|nr:S41 family peptidase [Solirubrobacteraceae bacterium]